MIDPMNDDGRFDYYSGTCFKCHRHADECNCAWEEEVNGDDDDDTSCVADCIPYNPPD